MSEHHEQGQVGEEPTLTPRIWVGSVADENVGHLHGAWVGAAAPPEEIRRAIQRVIKTSPESGAQEWSIFGYENFGAYKPDQHEDIDTIAVVAEGIERHGFAFAAWADLSDARAEDLEVEFGDAFMGHYDSTKQFIESILDDFDVEQTLLKALPAWLASHVRIDREGIARDMQAGDLHIEDALEGGIYVFRI